MGWWRVSADTLAGSRFVVSALAETCACLIALERGTASHQGERAWLDAHRAAYRARLSADPVTELLVRTGLGRHWLADLLGPAPAGEDEPDPGPGLARLRQTPTEAAQADLATAAGGRLPSGLRRPDLPERAADLLEWVWTETVLPDWPRRRQIMEADVVARTAELSRGGWTAALAGLRPGMRWLGSGRLQINAYDYPPREISGAELVFVPVTSGRGWAAWDEPRRYALIYPCSGALAEAGQRPAEAPEPLTALLGPGRARVLVLLAAPKSTTQLVALTGQGLGSVGRHLKILLQAGLVRRRRAGRAVLYYQTRAGRILTSAAQPESAGGRGGGNP
ncbi:MAG: ArsR family transcriptional regulator [Actinobacteria bacterium]|nr:ArsR family transcriptional regulator [Actinomycetota bacterium]